MAQKILLALVDPSMTVGQLLSAYEPLGFQVYLSLENRVDSMLDAIRGTGEHERVIDLTVPAPPEPEPVPTPVVPLVQPVPDEPTVATKVDFHPLCPCGCGKEVVNLPHGRPKVWASAACRRNAARDAKKARDAARAADVAPTTPVPVQDVPEPPAPAVPPAPPASEAAVPVPKCGRCDQDGHWAIDCQYRTQAAARKALGTAKQTTGKIKEPPATPSQRAPMVDPRPEPERPVEQERVLVPGTVDLTDDDVLGKHALALREQWSGGYPHDFMYLPDVLALYGVTEDIVESALRNPDRVEVRPESFDKAKRYAVLGFFKGDVSVILGLRNVHQPCVIAVYVGSMLEHDIHRVGHTGGGGAKKDAGIPTTPAKVAQRLRGLGAKVAIDSREDKAPVTYLGEELGFIQTSTNTPRLTCQTDFQRMQRKMHALDRREAAVR